MTYLEREKGGRETGEGFVPPYRVGVSFCGWLWNSATEKHRDAHTKDQNTPGPHPHTHLQQALMSTDTKTPPRVLGSDRCARARTLVERWSCDKVHWETCGWETNSLRKLQKQASSTHVSDTAELITTKGQDGYLWLWFISALFSRYETLMSGP